MQIALVLVQDRTHVVLVQDRTHIDARPRIIFYTLDGDVPAYECRFLFFSKSSCVKTVFVVVCTSVTLLLKRTDVHIRARVYM